MSTTPTTPPTLATSSPQGPSEICVISHSGLFYWWPVWFFGFIFALWTYIEGNRMAIVPSDSVIVKENDGTYKIEVGKNPERLIKDSTTIKDGEFKPKARVTSRSWIGPVYLVILFLVILITNVPLRGLWSLVTIIGLVLLSVLFSLFNLWDDILENFGSLHVYQNMAGYLFLSTVLFIAWMISVNIFDKRAYMIVTPGQIKVCEEIGGRERVYDTTGMSIEKHRDDWFRHIILGFGSGDLTVRTSGADKHEITLPNVAFIGYKIGAIETLVRERMMKA